MAKEPYLVLARKWRPQAFEDVVGQEHITRTLQNALASGRIGHAFLFIGSRGIGKTTTARILAKALNCEESEGPTPNPCGECDTCRGIQTGNHIDVMEIDGASNNSVESVRELRENIRLAPSRSRYKVYIIDEVHQLSGAAFNALLKTLEEPPEHAIFILATTENRKIPPTIVSRCQRYDFRRVSIAHTVELLRRIVDAEGLACSDEALNTIARAADGGIRDAESILEQVISYCDKEITFQDVNDVLGLIDWQLLHNLTDALIDKDVVRLIEIVDEVVAGGKDLSQFLQDILQYLRNLLVCKTADAQRLLTFPEEEIALMSERAAQFTLTGLIRLIEQFADLARDFDTRLAQRIALETLLIRVSKVSEEVSLDAVLEKLLALEAGGGPGEAPGAGPGPSKSPDTEKPPVSGSSGPARPAKTKRKTSESSGEPAASSSGEQTAQAQTLTMTEHNISDVWESVVQKVGEIRMALGVRLGGVRPAAIDGDALVLHTGQQNGSARNVLEKAENRQLLEETLQAMTGNIRTFYCEQPAPPAESAERQAPSSQLPIGGKVDPREAQAVLDDPHIQQVVDVFKGRIVEIKRKSG